MSRTLRDDLAGDFLQMLAASEFAEDALYLPAHNLREVPVRAIVRDAETDEHQRHDESVVVEAINVRLGKYPEASIGGVAQPAIGAGFIREGEQRDRAYSFVRVVSGNRHSWLLRFERHTTIRIGTAQTQSR